MKIIKTDVLPQVEKGGPVGWDGFLGTLVVAAADKKIIWFG